MVYHQLELIMHQDDQCILFLPSHISASQLVVPMYSWELGTVMDKTYVRLGVMLEPTPPQKLPSIDEICKITYTIGLMRSPSIRKPFD